MSGEVELLVDQINSSKEHLLDTLPQGSIIGQYSVLNESHFQFSARAKTDVSLLLLKRNDLLSLAEHSEMLQDSIEEATEYILDSEVPILSLIHI